MENFQKMRSSVKPNSDFPWVPETRAGIKIDPKYESTVYLAMTIMQFTLGL